MAIKGFNCVADPVLTLLSYVPSPDAIYETKDKWNERAASGKVYRLTTVVLADRGAGHNGLSSAYKPWGDALRLPVSPGWLTILRDRLLAGYVGDRRAPDKHVITYLQRQNSGSRRLEDEDHEALWARLQEIGDEGLAEVRMEEFNASVPFEEQVARIARTTVSRNTARLRDYSESGVRHLTWFLPRRFWWECTATA